MSVTYRGSSSFSGNSPASTDFSGTAHITSGTNILTVDATSHGAIVAGGVVTMAGVPTGTTIQTYGTSGTTGTGGLGTYALSANATATESSGTALTITTFAPNAAGDTLLAFVWDFNHGALTAAFTGSGTYALITPPGSAADSNNSTWAVAANLSCVAGQQSINVSTGTGDNVLGFWMDYSGAQSVINGAFTQIAAPGTGAGAIAGQTVTVASGDVLVCMVGDATGNNPNITSPSGTARSNNGPVHLYEYVGTGGSITPTFTTDTGADNYIVYQFVVSASSGAPVSAPYVPAQFAQGPGVSPNKRSQFRASPRGFVPPPIPTTSLGLAAAAAVSSAASSMSSFRTSGGLGYVSQPGPGVGPFSNNQFQSAPRAIISGAPQFLMTAAATAAASGNASLSALQSWAAQAQSAASALASLTTLSTSGGAAAYVTQPGPGVGPFSNNQFLSSPRSTNKGFQALVGSASSSAVASGVASLATSIQLRANSSGAAQATAALTSGNNLAASAAGAASASGTLTAAARMAAAASSVSTASAAPLTGITLACNVTGLSYASAALGSGTSLTVTAAGLASANAALLTQTIVSASAAGSAVANAQLGTNSQLAASAAAAGSTTAGLSASIQLNAQATGLARTTAPLSGSIVLIATATGFASGSGALNSGTSLMAAAVATAYSAGSLQTAVAPYSVIAQGKASASANLNGNITLTATAGSLSASTASLLTVLQPPGEFADIRWLRAPRGGDVAYAEFFQAIGEQLWYGVDWEDWLASGWEANASATVNQVIRPTVPNGLEFVCAAAGQTGAVEPIWPAYVGGVVVDGLAVWQGQAVTTASLDDTISGSAFSAPAGIVLDSGQVLTERSYLIIDTTNATVGTNYDVLCTIYTTGGQQKIAKLRIKVR